MNWITVGVGVAGILFGVYTLIIRITAPDKFSKLKAMKDLWGDKVGLAVHVIGYTVVPIMVGISFVRSGIQGASLFGN